MLSHKYLEEVKEVYKRTTDVIKSMRHKGKYYNSSKN